MRKRTRREFLTGLGHLGAAAAASRALPLAVQRALATPANRRTGTIRDVEHIVILTQENRSFDHYFGTMAGVRGFGDPFPIPVPDRVGFPNKNVWHQSSATPGRPVVTPFRLDTSKHFEYTRVEGTPHGWTDAQKAWAQGRMHEWAVAKRDHSLAYFAKEDIPFQWALANAFTLCDAYHCSMQGGTNPNRLFVWTGTNDPLALGNGPALYNDYEWFEADPGKHGGYNWTTYPQRLERAGISWQVYEDMADNYTDNPLAGFRIFRDAWFEVPGYSQALRERGISTRDLLALAYDVQADRLPQVSWIVAPEEACEHPGPSSPAQGAAFVARVLDALTANPEVWSRTVLLINFDENDGFFDHAPPPAPPSYIIWDADPAKALLAGDSTVATTGEYHEHPLAYHDKPEEATLLHHPYGLGPRVPLYVISPWSKGGWVNSQVFDHTSVIRFVEARFGVKEPNISPWRRSVCGDLTSAFDFARPEELPLRLPDTSLRAAQARALPGRTTPLPPRSLALPEQEAGVRPSRALPYELDAWSRVRTPGSIDLEFANTGAQTAVFHVYDRLRLLDLPRRFTVEAGKSLTDIWPHSAAGAYDLWALGPNGFHRHFRGHGTTTGAVSLPQPEVRLAYLRKESRLLDLTLINGGDADAAFLLTTLRYGLEPLTCTVPGLGRRQLLLPLPNGPWYDFEVTVYNLPGFSRRCAGRIETGQHSFSDPAMGGPALGDSFRSV